MRGLLQNRDARLLLVGQSLRCSATGRCTLCRHLGETLTGSNAQAGLVFFVLAAPGLVAPAFGLAVDRMRKRPLMSGTDVAIGLVLLTLLFVHGRGDVWIIYAVTLIYGASGYLFSSAQSALLTRMLPPERLGDANAALQTVSEGSRLIAPLIGAGLFAAVGGAAVAVLDSATFAVSALCLLGVRLREERPGGPGHHPRAGGRGRAPHRAHRRAAPDRAGHRARAARRRLHRDGDLRNAAARPAPAAELPGRAQRRPGGRRHRGRRHRLGRPSEFGDGRTLGVGVLLFAAGDALFLIPSLVPVLVGFAIAGAGLSWAVVAFGTAIQLRTPADLQGRVYSAADMILGTPQTLSIGLGAALITVVDYRVLIVVMGVVAGACGVFMAVAGAPADPVPEPPGL